MAGLFYLTLNMPDPKTIWTIGHSTHTLEELVDMLQSFKIKVLADIRSYPGSKRLPHFNKANLEIALPKAGIEYIHMINLGGRRKLKPDSVNTEWEHPAFRGYADYMETGDFQNAIIELEKIAIKERTAYMCSEAVWWRCHRSLVSDYLKVRGWTVLLIMGKGKSTEHTYTKPAHIIDGRLTYSEKDLFN